MEANVKFKVIVQAGSITNHSNYDLEREILDLIGAELIEVESDNKDDFINEAKSADALIAGKMMLSRDIIENLENCKIISIGSVGTDTIDVIAATDHGIPVTNDPDTFIDEVADHTLTLILSTYRRLTLLHQMSKDGRWKEARPYLYQFPRLMGQCLGLIAFGHVARAVAKRAKPFGFNIIAYDPYISETTISEYGAIPVNLDELLKSSDIVSMHAPGSEETEQMLKEKHFKLMKKTALFVNNGRGSTIHEPSLIKALQQNWIAGAGLDVLDQEPPNPDNPLLSMNNVIVTPHVASASSRFDPQRRIRVAREIRLALSGKWPIGCVNPSVLITTNLKRWQPYSTNRGPAR